MPKPLFSGLRHALLIVLCAGSALPAGLAAEEPLIVKMSILPGLKFDQTRFAVKPGQQVTIKLQNPDQMIHNLVITEPGARAEIVSAALALGAEGPAKNFIPESKKVLHSTKALNPGESAELTFTAPEKEAVYPYVCTSMGHGFVMYGAMYVTTKPLPPLDADPNVPPSAAPITDASDFSHTILDHPVISRTFLPDCGPAAIAVGLAGGQSYVFDAGLCRLRYAWKGGFVDNGVHWAGKGDTFSKVVGRIYYRAPAAALIRLGSAKHEPAARWKGYEIAKDGTPTFHYTLDDLPVSETPQPLTDGSGLVFHYAIDSKGAAVFLVTPADGGAKFTASAGTWQDALLGDLAGEKIIFDRGLPSDLRVQPGSAMRKVRLLTLQANEAAKFTLTMAEVPGVEPLGYWSMNDLPFVNMNDPAPGVVGRAFTPVGTDSKKKPQRLSTGIQYSQLRNGGTLMAWVKLGDAKTKAANLDAQPVFSVGDKPGYGLVHLDGPEDGWVHIAAVLDPKGHSALYHNGQADELPGVMPGEEEGEIYIGSRREGEFLTGLIDEARIWDRVLSAEEIKAIYQRESANLKGDK